jgi:hypothetical protein
MGLDHAVGEAVVGDLVARALNELGADAAAIGAVGIERIGVGPLVLELVTVAGRVVGGLNVPPAARGLGSQQEQVGSRVAATAARLAR